MSFHLAGLHWNPLKYEGIETAKIILKTLERHSIEYTLDEPLATYLGLPNKTDLISGFANVDLLIILGGDGTILRSLDDCVPAGIPILGVNLGRLGFLTEVERDCVVADLEQVLNNDYYIEERMLLSVEGYSQERWFALNEIAVVRSSPEVRTLSLAYYADGKLVNRVSGDGLIIATATGSTGYSLSAGGPIVLPSLDCIVVTPICPHILNIRPVILPASTRVTVQASTNGTSARAVLDGRRIIDLDADHAELHIVKSKAVARFIRIHEDRYFSLLQGKLSDRAYL